jgi:thioredoxin reductase
MAAPYDALIVGGGPAALSAALVLGRCTRRVMLMDSGRYRNAASREMHCFLGFDGIDPAELRALGRRQLAPYETVEWRRGEVAEARIEAPGFHARLADGTVRARTLLLATGVVDDLPKLEGLDRFYGVTAHVCPYCDGWECRDLPVAVYGKGERGARLAMMLRLWTPDLTVLTDGPAEFPPDMPEKLIQCAIKVVEKPVARLSGEGDRLAGVEFADGSAIEARQMFFNVGEHLRSPLFAQLGCTLDSGGGVFCDENGLTSVPGVYVAGDASRDVQLAIVAAAEGAKAAEAINRQLLAEDGMLP